VGTCLAGGETNGNGVGVAGGCADGAMLVLNWFPSFLFSKINYMFDKDERKDCFLCSYRIKSVVIRKERIFISLKGQCKILLEKRNKNYN
jgi:hypothetical protein